ncbi:hypothetical protein [Dankookia sp. GCM10030260]|uniref:hypothetical protein n=1 Tax=Dankookia sp. GCM10030260 TaxID=3273390 RepID=UPI0036D2F7A5
MARQQPLPCGAATGAVNLTEVAGPVWLDPTRAAAWPDEGARPSVGLSASQAARTGVLLPAWGRQGLLLGDAACLGTAAGLGLPVPTAGRRWAGRDTGVVVRRLH